MGQVSEHPGPEGVDTGNEAVHGTAPSSPPRGNSGQAFQLAVPRTRSNLAPLVAAGLQGLLEDKEANRRQMASYIATAGTFAMREQLRRTLNGLLQQPFRSAMTAFQIQTLSAVGAASRVDFANSVLTGAWAGRPPDAWLTNSRAMVQVVSGLQSINITLASQIGGLGHIAAFVEHHNSLLAAIHPFPEVAHPVGLATRALRNVFRDTPTDATGRYVDRFEVAGRGTGWAVQAGIALSEEDEDRVDQYQLQASLALGPAGPSADLRDRLAELNPYLRVRLDGAWERINRGGPDGASQAANSLMELVDWTLRLLAPDNEVLAWHAADNRPAKELHDGRPTRPARVSFVVRNSPEKNSSLSLYLKAVQELAKLIQDSKHPIEVGRARALAPIALTVEGVLHFLLVD